MPPQCGYKGCIKQGATQNKATNGKFYCNLTHLKAAGAERDEVAKAKQVSSKICSLLLLLVSLFIQLTLSPFVLFSPPPTEAAERQEQSQEQSQGFRGTYGDETGGSR